MIQIRMKAAMIDTLRAEWFRTGRCFTFWSPQYFLQFLGVYQHWQLAENCYCFGSVSPCLWRSSLHSSVSIEQLSTVQVKGSTI